ncbi:MAG: HPr family phosphocarrier protein [Bacillota bacterium]|nr:HPr family phosphocarrier protein [Bacillota bacterium]
MIREEVRVGGPHGLHARPAAQLVQEAARFESRLRLYRGERGADAKSILEVMSLAARPGETVILEAEGPDEKEAVARLKPLIKGEAPS